jgi:hypothetical protein
MPPPRAREDAAAGAAAAAGGGGGGNGSEVRGGGVGNKRSEGEGIMDCVKAGSHRRGERMCRRLERESAGRAAASREREGMVE